MGKSYVTKKNLFKFLLGSAFGILMFLVPIPQGESFTTLLDFLKSWIKGLFGSNLSYIITVMLVFSAVVSVYDFIAKPDWIRKNHYLSRAFSTTPLYLGSKILGAVFAVMIVFKIGPEMIISADTGATMIDLCGTLFSIVLAFSFILPFLTDCGIMEFLGVIAKPLVRPLFHVPGRASVDLIASWFGASNAAVILTREQYMKGFYTKREAGYIMTNFSLVSIPFCLMVADTMGIANLFPPFYLCICIVGIILAVIIARIPPIKTIPNTYRESVGKQINEEIPQEKGIFAHAVEMSCKRAESFNVKTVGTSGLEVLMGMFFDLIPIVVAVFENSNPDLMIISISACMAGAVCGDHCSPISDTTIMASAGAQCEHVNHVTTQLPYAVTAAVVSFVSYIIAGFVQSAWIALPIAIALMVATMFVIRAVNGVLKEEA